MSSPRFESGSFRDRDSRVFLHAGRIHRALSERGAADWQALARTRFYPAAVAAGKVVATEAVELPAEVLAALGTGSDASWAGALVHETLPFVSYPYEWSFSMLREAARLQLELLAAALAEDLTLKDGSAYNVQWRGVEPVFIDVGSFQRWRPGEPWIGYLQFCQLCLYPLLLTSYKDLPFQPWLRGGVGGIAPEACAAVMSWRDLLRPGVLTHVVLQAKLQGQRGDGHADLRGELARAGFDKRLILANVARLRRLVDGLAWRRARSTWSEYATDNSYSAEDREAKHRFVEAAAAQRRPRLAWDLGANTGEFARRLAAHAGTVIAMDSDHLAVDRMFQSLRRDGVRNVLPLVNDLADPSPGLGWRGRERRSLVDRPHPDLTLALALLHHLVLGANLPLPEVVDWLAELGSDLVVEMVAKDDPMAQRLLRDKDDIYFDFTPAAFEHLLEARFHVHERLPLASGTRTLYRATPR